MTLSPGYGETPLDGDEFDALLPPIRDALGENVTKAAVFDLEQAVQDEVAAELLSSVFSGELDLQTFLSDSFIRELHRRLSADIWSWGGRMRIRELTLGVAVHAETVRIHPFADGNGRTTRLLADLVFVAAQESAEPDLYEWSLDKRRYISLLREYDVHRNATELAAFIGVRPLSAQGHLTPPPTHPTQQTSQP